MTVLQTSARARETGLITLDIVTARGTEMLMESTSPMLNNRSNVFLDSCSKNTGKLYMCNVPSWFKHLALMLSMSGQGATLNIPQSMLMLATPTNPYKYTILRGWMIYLLNSIFYTMYAPVVKNNDSSSSITPIICKVTVTSFD